MYYTFFVSYSSFNILFFFYCHSFLPVWLSVSLSNFLCLLYLFLFIFLYFCLSYFLSFSIFSFSLSFASFVLSSFLSIFFFLVSFQRLIKHPSASRYWIPSITGKCKPNAWSSSADLTMRTWWPTSVHHQSAVTNFNMLLTEAEVVDIVLTLPKTQSVICPLPAVFPIFLQEPLPSSIHHRHQKLE